MASTVLSGSSNPSYTNNTGQNVRIIINFMAGTGSTPSNIAIALNWAGVSASARLNSIGRNLAVYSSQTFAVNTNLNTADTGALSVNNASGYGVSGALPTELMLAPNQTFSANCGAYNIVIIPEAG